MKSRLGKKIQNPKGELIVNAPNKQPPETTKLDRLAMTLRGQGVEHGQ